MGDTQPRDRPAPPCVSRHRVREQLRMLEQMGYRPATVPHLPAFRRRDRTQLRMLEHMGDSTVPRPHRYAPTFPVGRAEPRAQPFGREHPASPQERRCAHDPRPCARGRPAVQSAVAVLICSSSRASVVESSGRDARSPIERSKEGQGCRAVAVLMCSSSRSGRGGTVVPAVSGRSSSSGRGSRAGGAVAVVAVGRSGRGRAIRAASGCFIDTGSGTNPYESKRQP